MAFWGLEIKPGKNPTPLNLERRLVIKQAALSVAKSSPEPVVLSVSVGKNGQQYVVCRLHEGKVEHCPLELPFTPEDQPMLHLKGAHAVHLTGFLEMEDEEELDEDEGMADATATKVAAGRQANGGGAAEEDDSEDDDSFEEGEEEEGEEEEGEEEEGDSEEESEEEEAPPPKAAKRPTPAAAAPPAKKAKAAASTPVPKAAPKAATPAASTPGTSGANSWTAGEDSKLTKALKKVGPDVDNRWDKIAKEVGTRNKDQCKKRLKQMNSPAK